MRPIGAFLAALASIATILMYLHLDPPWVREYLPHIAWPSNTIQTQTAPATSAPVIQTPSGDFVGLYENGLRAARRRDFTMAVEFYKSAATSPVATDQERSKAYDALGYSYFRMGDFDDADKALATSLTLNPSAVTPRVNQIKVMCAQHVDAAGVQTALQSLRTSITGDAYDTRETETDKELFRVCEYTGITPQ